MTRNGVSTSKVNFVILNTFFSILCKSNYTYKIISIDLDSTTYVFHKAVYFFIEQFEKFPILKRVIGGMELFRSSIDSKSKQEKVSKNPIKLLPF